MLLEKYQTAIFCNFTNRMMFLIVLIGNIPMPITRDNATFTTK